MDRDKLRRDLIAGLSVFLVAVPLCLGVAQASGAPPVAGLISGIIGGIVIGLLSSSHLSVSGPAAGLTVIVAGGIEHFQDYTLFLPAVILAGALQLLLAYLRLGTVNRLFPSPVIKAMLAAIGLILVLKQTPHMVGYDREAFGLLQFGETSHDLDPDYEGPKTQEFNTFTILAHAHKFMKPGACLIGLFSLGLLFLWDKKFAKRFPTVPGSLVAVVFALVVNALLSAYAPEIAVAGKHLVSVPDLSNGVLRFPNWKALTDPFTYRLALTLGIVASIESLLCLEAIDRLDPQSRKSGPNRELRAQGIGNLLSGFVGGIPVTSVIVRSSVNLAAGAASRWSAIFHGIYLLLTLLFFRVVVNQVPLSVLAAVLVHVGIKMAAPKTLQELRKRGRSQWVPYVVTVVAILFTDLLVGIAVGLLVSAFFILRNLYDSQGFTVHRSGRVTRIAFNEEVTFFHKARLGQVLETIEPRAVVEFDGRRSFAIDQDVIDVIAQFRRHAINNNIQVIVGGIPLVSSYTQDQMNKLHASYDELITNNREWVQERLQENPTYFEAHQSNHQARFLFIGCSDSRVPAEAITKTQPGRLFVHRNIANMVSPHDVNLMSVLEYSVEVLNLPHIIVCGHYGCGGIQAALSNRSLGLIDNWIQPVKQLVREHQAELDAITDPESRERRIVELHVIQQVRNILKCAVVQKSLHRLGTPLVHGWVYDVDTGYIKDLKAEIDIDRDLEPVYRFQNEIPLHRNGEVQPLPEDAPASPH